MTCTHNQPKAFKNSIWQNTALNPTAPTPLQTTMLSTPHPVPYETSLSPTPFIAIFRVTHSFPAPCRKPGRGCVCDGPGIVFVTKGPHLIAACQLPSPTVSEFPSCAPCTDKACWGPGGPADLLWFGWRVGSTNALSWPQEKIYDAQKRHFLTKIK